MNLQLRKLTEAEYQATFSAPMREITKTAGEITPIWPYAEAAMAEEFPDASTDNWDTEYVYEDPERKWQHILINTEMSNAYLVIIVDLSARAIHGHHFLNLNQMYGLSH